MRQVFPRFLAVVFTSVGLIAPESIAWAQQLDPNPASIQTNNDRSPWQATNFEHDKLVPWCIVPFDAKERSPAERVAMLQELGLKRVAYDWRDEHVATFEEEFRLYQEHGIELFAFWGIHERALELFQVLELHPQIWLTLGDPGGPEADRVQTIAKSLLPVVEKTAALELPLGLYNHGGWGGHPENMVAVCQHLHALGHSHVGIVYNFHHGHEHIADWTEALRKMMPYLLCLNLNGMNPDAQPKILAIGKGQHESPMIQTIIDSGYSGPIGIIDHQEHRDTREVLIENLRGLDEVLQQSIPRLGGQPSSQSSDLSFREYHPDLVSELVEVSGQRGNADRGAAIFGSDQVACVSCHQMDHPTLGAIGGNLGPSLTSVLGRKSPQQIVESLLWPQREVAPEFKLWQVLTGDGKVHTGYRLDNGEQTINLRDTANGQIVSIGQNDVESISEGGSPMPDGLLSRLSPQQGWDIVNYLFHISQSGQLTAAQADVIAQSYQHGPASFQASKSPVQPDNWPNHTAHVNRDRVYDYYTKQAEHFRQQEISPWLLPAYPGLDGGSMGHWGNQNETSWADNRWNDTVLTSVQSGVFRHENLTVPRGICLQMGDPISMACCFDPKSFSYPAVWQDGFVRFSDVRHGFLDGLLMKGKLLEPAPPSHATEAVAQTQLTQGRFLGYYRFGNRTVFSYEVDRQVFLDAAWVLDGKFVREVAPVDSHSLKDWVTRPREISWPSQWTEEWITEITTASFGPLAIDTIQLPTQNKWNALFFIGGHDFLADGSALVCTMQGDVWKVSGLQAGSSHATWRRFASGLHQPLGIWIDRDGVFVTCRDQIMRLTDFNEDGEADYYECFSSGMNTSPAGHDFICDLQRDSYGNFYVASGNQGLVCFNPNGTQTRVLATGFRNPDGLGLMANGFLTVPNSEGNWIPTSMICSVSTDSGYGGPFAEDSEKTTGTAPIAEPYFGYGGPRLGQPPDLPMVYLPRGLDNSSGGQSLVPSGSWGALAGNLLHLSYGAGSWFTVLVDEVDGVRQAAAAPVIGDFASGVHRGRFSKADGHFYVSGMGGWGTYTTQDGCFQRIRMTDLDFQHPIGFHAYRNGLLLQFAQPLDASVASNLASHYAQAWNYRYSGGYGSAEYSPSHPGMIGHDHITITQACVVGQKTLFLEIPDLQPVNQLHLRMHVNPPEQFLSLNPVGSGHDLFLTIHRLDKEFTEYPSYRTYEKQIATHPILRDIASLQKAEKNPWLKGADPQHKIELRTGKNLSFEQPEIRVEAGQQVQLTLINADVVPHNWVLVQPGSLQTVGEQVNRMIASPDAYLKQYVPDSDVVLVYTDIVEGGQQQTIHFKAPTAPGRYPYLCTFPGHWMVMNGVLLVEE